MTVTIHQPSYLVWSPLLEKMATADLFIYLDDVEYSKNSEINRNRALSGQGPQWLTVPVNTSSSTLIKDVQAADERWTAKHWKTILQCYSKAPFFGPAERESMEELYTSASRSLLEVNLAFTEWLRKQTGISTPAILSSELGVTSASSRRILDLCQAVGAKRYLSGSAGLDYLDLAEFDEAGIEVLVQNYQHRPYSQQFRLPEFVPRLSAIDMYFNLGPATLSEIQTRGEWLPVAVAAAH